MYTVLSHDDLDGYGCIYLLRKLYPKIKTFTVPGANRINWGLFAGRSEKFYITDLCLTPEALEVARRNNDKVIYLDHHGEDDGKPCGTWQVFEYIRYRRPEILTKDDERFARLVDVYDRWQETHPEWEQAVDLNANFFMLKGRAMRLPRRDAVNSILAGIARPDEGLVRTYHMKVRQAVEEVEEKLKHLVDKNGNILIFTERATVFNDTSIICNHLLNDHPDARYVIMSFGDRVSVRSRADDESFSCTDLPGIEGHKCAAGGFYSPELREFIGRR